MKMIIIASTGKVVCPNEATITHYSAVLCYFFNSGKHKNIKTVVHEVLLW